VVLVNPRNPLNVGAAARAMRNFGVGCLRLVNPYELAFREARSAVGASTVLKQATEYGTLAEAVGDCTLVVGTTAARNRELHHPVRRLETGARLIRKHLAGGRVALLFGSEKRGLSNTDLSHCHWLLRIATREQQVSMNLGQAVAVCLYELTRGSESQRPRDGRAAASPSATAAEQERVTEVLMEALLASGYLQRSAAAQDKLRRLVRRLDLRAEDAEIWLGMLRQIAWKLRRLE
jgi:TrmH family RNA methyltransferase